MSLSTTTRYVLANSSRSVLAVVSHSVVKSAESMDSWLALITEARTLPMPVMNVFVDSYNHAIYNKGYPFSALSERSEIIFSCRLHAVL